MINKSVAIMLLSIVSSTMAEPPQVSVTVYNNNLALVREVRSLDLKKGVQTFSFVDVAAQIDPTSVHFKSLTSPESVVLREQNYEYDLVGTARLLEKYIDQEIVVTTEDGDAYTGKLLSSKAGDVLIEISGNRIKSIKADALLTIEFPSLPEGLITRPTLVWLLECNKSGLHSSEISYLTRGIQWHAEYVAVTNPGDTELELGGWVSIENNSGAAYRDARLKLVAGDVHQAQEPRRGVLRKETAMVALEAAPQFEEKSFFEYHLYTLQRPATLADRQIKQLSLFDPVQVKVAKIYSFDGAQDQNKIRVSLEFKNDKASGLGLPLPKGKIRVYKEDEDRAQEFIGEDYIDHMPTDEKIRIYLGNAFDIVGERTVKDVRELNKRLRQETVEIQLRNHKDENVDIHVIEHFWGDWQFVGTTPKVIEQDARKVEFLITVPESDEVTVTYTVNIRR